MSAETLLGYRSVLSQYLFNQNMKLDQAVRTDFEKSGMKDSNTYFESYGLNDEDRLSFIRFLSN